MSKYLFFLLATAVLFVGCRKRESVVQQQIDELNKKFQEAFLKEDAGGIMSCYMNDSRIVAMFPDTTVRGYDTVKHQWEKIFSDVNVKEFQITESHVFVEGDAAIEWGFWKAKYQMAAGGSDISVENGRYTQVWSKQNGNWYLVVHHASVPLPSQAPATTKQ